MANENFKEQLDIAKKLLEYQEKELEFTLKTDETFKSRVKTMNDIASNQNDMTKLAKIERDTTKEVNRLTKIGHTAIAEKYDNQQKLVQSRLKELRTEVLANKARDTADKLTGGMASKLKEGLKFSKGMGKAALAKYAAMGLVVGAVALLGKALSYASGIIDKLGEKFGVLGTQAGQFRDNLMLANADAIALGFSIDDVTGSVFELSANFGVGVLEASKLPKQILDTGLAIGLTEQQATKLFGTLMSVGNLTADQAEHLAESTFQLAQQNNVNPVAVMQDMAESAEVIAKFGADNLESISKAAVQARQLGINLSSVDKIADSLLDFQTSLTNEIEASVLIGKGVNLQKARELALTGDLSAMMDNVLKQVGGEAEFNKLNVIQRKSLAKALGVEVTEMEKIVSAGGKQVEQAKSFRDLAGPDALSALTSVVNKIKSIGATLLQKFGTPLNDLLKKFEKNFFSEENIARITDFINNFDKIIMNIGESISTIFSVFSGISSVLAGIYNFITHPVVAGLIGFGFGGPLGALAAAGSAMLVNDFKSGGGSHLIVTPMGKVLQTNPKDTVFGTTKVNDFASFPEGGLPNGTDMSETNSALRALNNRIDTLISATKNNATATAQAIDEL